MNKKELARYINKRIKETQENYEKTERGIGLADGQLQAYLDVLDYIKMLDFERKE